MFTIGALFSGVMHMGSHLFLEEGIENITFYDFMLFVPILQS